MPTKRLALTFDDDWLAAFEKYGIDVTEMSASDVMQILADALKCKNIDPPAMPEHGGKRSGAGRKPKSRES